MPLQINAKYFKQKAGLYVLSNSNVKDEYKIGLSTSLYSRLSSYHTCFHKGYLIHNIVNLVAYDTKTFSLQKDNKKKQITLYIRDMEKRVHKKLEKYNLKGTKGNTGREWFRIKDIQLITDAIREAFNEKSNLDKKKNYVLTANRERTPTIITDMNNIKYG